MATAINELKSIKVNEIAWSGRAAAALKNGGLLDKTLADVDNIKDDELLSINRMGRGSLGEIRQKIVQAGARAREEKMKQDMDQRNADFNTGNNTNDQPVPDRREIKVRSNSSVEDKVMEFAKTHPSIINSIINEEVILVPRL
jgi:hypothetical protein